MTVCEFQARRIERLAQALAHFIATTQEHKLDWHPEATPGITGRSVYEQISECAAVNCYVAALLRGETPQQTSIRSDPPMKFTGSIDAEKRLTESARELADAVRALKPEDLPLPFPHWRGPISGEILIEMPYRNMAYHAGQINYIQTLYGDTEFHLPGTWI